MINDWRYVGGNSLKSFSYMVQTNTPSLCRSQSKVWLIWRTSTTWVKDNIQKVWSDFPDFQVFLSLLQSPVSACVHISSPHILHADLWHWLQHWAARFSLEQPGPERQNTHQFYSNRPGCDPDSAFIHLYISVGGAQSEEVGQYRWGQTWSTPGVLM